MMQKKVIIVAVCLFVSAVSSAQIAITEWMYSGTDGEFIELTNVGTTAIDMTDWSFDDSHRKIGQFVLSALGVVAPGESVILAEKSPDDFRTAWNLNASVRILSGYVNNLGRGDEINIYDAEGGLVDRLTFEDDGEAGGPKTQNVSGNITKDNLGRNRANNAVLSFIGDSYGSRTSSGGDLANPGRYHVPEPTSMILLALGMGALLRKKN
jgi:predicted extracellular nuclease